MITATLFISLFVLAPAGRGETVTELTLAQAIDRVLNHTVRGEMIEGNLEVAAQYYSARRTNLYFPEVSIVGSAPSYQQDKSYRPFGNQFDKRLIKTTNLDFRSFIELKQSLVTGGSLVATANLSREKNRLPDTRVGYSGLFYDENSQLGYFNFQLEQPLFRPSSVKFELNNRRDDLQIAQMTHIEQTAALKKEVTEEYLESLQLSLELSIAEDKMEQAILQARIDSIKLIDGILSNEDNLLSVSNRLDAELAGFEAITQKEEQRRQLTTLLDIGMDQTIRFTEPDRPHPPDSATKARLLAAWETTVPIVKAEHEYEKKKRQAEYSASGHRITGDLSASYSLGRGEVEKDFADLSPSQEDINTSGWTVALNFRMPIWDGGAGSAAVKAARFEAEQARYDFTQVQRSAQASIATLLNQIDVGYQRLEIIKRQIGLAYDRLEIARGRFDNGEISKSTLLDSRIFWLEQRDKYLDELRSYLTNILDLESKFVPER